MLLHSICPSMPNSNRNNIRYYLLKQLLFILIIICILQLRNCTSLVCKTLILYLCSELELYRGIVHIDKDVRYHINSDTLHLGSHRRLTWNELYVYPVHSVRYSLFVIRNYHSDVGRKDLHCKKFSYEHCNEVNLWFTSDELIFVSYF